MPTFREEFIERQVARGTSRREAELLYEQMEPRLSAPEPEPQTEFQDELDLASGDAPSEPTMVGGGLHHDPKHRTHEFDYKYPDIAVNREKLLKAKAEEIFSGSPEIDREESRKQAREYVDHLEIVKGRPVDQDIIDAHVAGQPGNEAADTPVKRAIRTLYPRLIEVPRPKTDRVERALKTERKAVKGGDPFEGAASAVGRALFEQSPYGAYADFADIEDIESAGKAVSGLLFPWTRVGRSLESLREDEDTPESIRRALMGPTEEPTPTKPEDLPGAATARMMYEHSPFAAIGDVMDAETPAEKALAAHAFVMPWARSIGVNIANQEQFAKAADELAVAFEPVDPMMLSPGTAGLTDEQRAELAEKMDTVFDAPSPIYVPRAAAESAQLLYDLTWPAGVPGKMADLAEWAGQDEAAGFYRGLARAKRAGWRREAFAPVEEAIKADAPDEEVHTYMAGLRLRDLPVSARLQRELTGDEVIAAADAEGVTNPTIEAMREAGWGDPMAAVEGIEPDPSILENMLIGEMPRAIQERLYSIDSLRRGVAEREQARADTGGAAVDALSGALEGLSGEYVPGEKGFTKAESTFGSMMRLAGVAQTGILQVDAPMGAAVAASVPLAWPALLLSRDARDFVSELRVPTAYGVDKMLGSPAIGRTLGTEHYTRLYSDDSTWGGRLMAQLEDDQQGLALILPDMAYSLGFGEDTAAYQTAVKLGIAGDFGFNWEGAAFKPVSVSWARGGTGLRYAMQMNKAKASTPGDVAMAFGAGAAPEFLAGRFDERTGAPWAVFGAVMETSARRNAVRGAGFDDQVARGQHDAVREVLRIVTGKDPDELDAMLGEYDAAAELNGLAHLDNIRKVMQSNTPRQQKLRATPDYRAMRAAAEQAEARGQLPKGGADWAMAVSEIEAMRAVLDGKVPRVETYFEQFRLKSVDAPGPEVVRPGVLPDVDEAGPRYIPDSPKVIEARRRFEQAALRAGMHEGEIIAALNNPRSDDVSAALHSVDPEVARLWEEYRAEVMDDLGKARVFDVITVGKRVRVKPAADGGRPMREFEGEVVEVYEPGSTRHSAGYRLKVTAGNARMMVRANDVVESVRGADGPATPGPVWFSRLEEGAVEAFPASGSMRAKGVVTKLKALAKKDPALAEELKWMDLSKLEELGRKKMTVDEFRAFMDENRVRVEEVRRGAATVTPESQQAMERMADVARRHGASEQQVHALQSALRHESVAWNMNDYAAEVFAELFDQDPEAPGAVELSNAMDAADKVIGARAGGRAAFARWSEYTQPGGENYREVLLTLPSATLSQRVAARQYLDLPEYHPTRRAHFNAPLESYAPEVLERKRAKIAEKRAEAERILSLPNYESVHWSEPNVLAHVRLSDRTTADGKRVLFVEELQSDWHQDARKMGTIKDVEKWTVVETDIWGKPQWTIKDHKGQTLSWDEVGEATDPLGAGAVQEGIGFPSDMVMFDDKDTAEAFLRELPTTLEGTLPPDAPFREKRWARMALRRVVRMAAEEGYDGVAVVRGEDIQRVVGGGLEGQKRFYNVNVPRYLADIGKPWGARPGDTTIGGTAGSVDRMGEALGWGVWDRDGGGAPVEMFGTAAEARAFVARQGDPARFVAGEFGDLETHEVPGALSATILDIPADMRRSVVERGLPLFQDQGGRAGGTMAAEPGLTPGPMWYSRLEEGTLEEFPASGKLRAKAIATKMRALAKKDPALADELEWVDLAELESKGRQKLSVDEYREWMRSQRLEVKDVTKVAGPDMFARPETQAAMDQLRAAVDDAGGGPGLFHELQSALRPEHQPFGTMEVDDPWVGHIINDIADGDPMHVERISKAYDDVVDSLVDEGPDEADAARWAEYQQPGGERYREILLTLPRRLDVAGWTARPIEGRESGFDVFDRKGERVARRPGAATAEEAIQAAAEYERTAPERVRDGAYRSTHWNEPNVLAHVRLTERTTADGERLLFIEEIQSDWHQAGRKKGYAKETPETRAQRDEIAERRARANELRDEVGDVDGAGMSDAELKEYVDSRLDKAALHDREADTLQRGLDVRVPDAPFKDKRWARLAMRRVARLAAEEGFDGIAIAHGDDVRRSVGGGIEGQRRFYGKSLPRYLDDIAKPWGVKTERMNLLPARARAAADWSGEAMVLRIPQAMRRSVVERGLPLFQEGADGARGSLETSGPLAPTFYSAVDNAIDRVFAKGAKSIKAESFLAMVRKQPDVKAEEIDFLGLEEWARGQGRVTREAAKAHVAAHQLELKDVIKGGRDPRVEAQAGEVERLNGERGRMMRRSPLIEFSSGRGSLRGTHIGNVEHHPTVADQRMGATIKVLRREDIFLNDLQRDAQPTPEELEQVQEAIAWSREYQKLNDEYGMAMRHLQELERESVDDPTRYEEWSHDGGRGYQELLITMRGDRELPPGVEIRERVQGGTRVFAVIEDGQYLGASETPEGARRFYERERGGQYLSHHWDEPNILAHVRFDTRIDEQGRRILFIHEVQSDWHQQGLKRGYRHETTVMTELPAGKVAVDVGGQWRVIDEGSPMMGRYYTRGRTQQAAIDEYLRVANLGVKHMVPDAPFKTSWHALAMKRMVRLAADGDYDAIAWPTGVMEAELFDLGGHVDELRWEFRDPEELEDGRLVAIKDGEEVDLPEDFEWDDLEEAIGDEPARLLKEDAKAAAARLAHSEAELIVVHELTEADIETWSLEDKAVAGHHVLLDYYGEPRANYDGDVMVFDDPVEANDYRRELLDDDRPNRDLDDTRGSISSGELKIGTKGMEAFYDGKLVGWAKKFAKKMGARVGMAELPEHGDAPQVHMMTLSPKMKRLARFKGQPLFQEKGGRAAGSIKVSKAKVALERLRRTPFVPTRMIVEMLGDRPEYLDGVIEFLAEQRQRLAAGKLTNRDVAKAYFMTVASMGSDAVRASLVEGRAGFRIPEDFVTYNKTGDRMVRPEEAAAAWLFTDDGQRALNAIERGEFDADAWGKGADVRLTYGDDRVRNSSSLSEPKVKERQVTMQNLQEATDAINRAGTDADALFKAAQRLAGIGEAKKAFIGHLLGMGSRATADAVEINVWLTGRGDIGRLKGKRAEVARLVKDTSSKRVARELSRRVNQSIRGLKRRGIGTDIPSEMFEHVVHHWIWDKAKGVETTHKGMYQAQRLAQKSETTGRAKGTIQIQRAADAVETDLEHGHFAPAAAEGEPVTAPPDWKDRRWGREIDSFEPAEQAAWDSYMESRGDRAEVEAELRRHAGTPWAKQAVEGAFVRIALRELAEGRQPTVASALDSTLVRGIRRNLDARGIEGLWAYLEGRSGFLSGASKPVNNVNGSFIDCRPSVACAKYCYATGGNYRYAGSIVKAELVTAAIEADPARAARRIAAEYKATAEFANNKALRLFDKGDLSDAWLPVIEELNRQGVRVQIFSKRPDVLEKVSDKNLRLLSVDDGALTQADAYPDLPVALVYRGEQDIEPATTLHERGQLQVVLPVKTGTNQALRAKAKEAAKGALLALRRTSSSINRLICPIDAGVRPIGKTGTKVETVKGDPSSAKDAWNCTKCDARGGIGCFYGKVTDAAMQSPDVVGRTTNELREKILRLQERLHAELEEAGGDLAAPGRAEPGRLQGLLGEVSDLFGRLLERDEPVTTGLAPRDGGRRTGAEGRGRGGRRVARPGVDEEPLFQRSDLRPGRYEAGVGYSGDPEILDIMLAGGRPLEVYKNPAQRDIRRIQAQARQRYPNARSNLVRKTYDVDGNVYLWDATRATHASVEVELANRLGGRFSQNEHLLFQRGRDPEWTPTITPLVARNYVSPRDKVRMSAEDRQTRDVAYALKRGDPDAVATAADELAALVPEGAVLVPVPDSAGSTAVNRALAEAVASRVGGEVRDVLTRGAPVESSRALRERGVVRQPGQHGIVASEQVADAFLVDNVITTGGTMRAAQDALGGGTPLAWADRSQRWGREQMLMQRAEAGEGLTVAQAEDAILEQLPFAGPLLDKRLQVVESFDDIDGGRWSDLDDGSQTAMWVPDGEGGPGTAYILAPRMTPELLQSAVVHEVGAHMGMRGLLGSEEARVLDRAAELARSATDGPAARAHTKAMADLEARGVDPESARGRELYRREALAYMVEVDPQNGIVRDLIARVRAWLYRTVPGFKRLNLTEADLRAMAIAALRNEARVAAGEPVPIGGGLAVGPRVVAPAWAMHDEVPLPKPRWRAHIDDLPESTFPEETVPEPAETTWGEIDLFQRDDGVRFQRAEEVDQTQTPEFKNFFGDWEADPANASKVVDPATGKPLVVYHATWADFDEFEIQHPGHSSAFYFGDDPSRLPVAWRYHMQGTDDHSVMPVYLNMRKPLVVDGEDSALGTLIPAVISPDDRAQIQAAGYDGIIWTRNDGGIEYIVFDGVQIKSATGNIGTFDPADPNILFQRGDGEAAAGSVEVAKPDRAPTATLFSGGGLVEEGLRGAIEPIYAVEFDENVAAHYAVVHGDHVRVGRVQDQDFTEASGADYLHASPVCKTSSLAKLGRNEAPLDIETARSTAEALRTIRPPVFTLENVANYGKTEAMRVITDELDKLGYKWDTHVYEAADYGAPTRRKRLLLRAVGPDQGELPPRPEPTHGPGAAQPHAGWYDAVSDIVDDLPDEKLADWQRKRLERHGIDVESLTEPLLVMGGSTNRATVPHAFGRDPAPTIKATPRELHRILLPDGRVKRVTPRAMARMTGLPDSYALPSSRMVATTIIGNGVPPALSRAVFEPLLEPMMAEGPVPSRRMSDADVVAAIERVQGDKYTAPRREAPRRARGMLGGSSAGLTPAARAEVDALRERQDIIENRLAEAEEAGRHPDEDLLAESAAIQEQLAGYEDHFAEQDDIGRWQESGSMDVRIARTLANRPEITPANELIARTQERFGLPSRVQARIKLSRQLDRIIDNALRPDPSRHQPRRVEVDAARAAEQSLIDEVGDDWREVLANPRTHQQVRDIFDIWHVYQTDVELGDWREGLRMAVEHYYRSATDDLTRAQRPTRRLSDAEIEDIAKDIAGAEQARRDRIKSRGVRPGEPARVERRLDLLRLAKVPEARLRRLGWTDERLPGDIAGGEPLYQPGDGGARGTFDTTTAVITLYQGSTLRTLWHEKGHLIDLVTGTPEVRLAMDAAFERMPESEVRALAAEAHRVGPKQAAAARGLDEADAINAQRYVQDGESGPMRTVEGREQMARMFEVWLERRIAPNGWLRMQFQQLQQGLADVWTQVRGRDLEVDPAVAAVWDRWLRPEHIADSVAVEIGAAEGLGRFPTAVVPETGPIKGAVARSGRAREHGRVNLRREEVLQDMGIRPGDEVPLHDLVSKAIRYVATEQARRQAMGIELVAMTARTVVPAGRVQGIQREAYASLAAAVGVPVRELLDGVGDDVVSLDRAQQAGLRTLANQVANNPVVDPRGFKKLIDPSSSLETVTFDEINALQEAQIDVMAGPGSRRDVRAEKISPTLGAAVARFLWEIPDKLQSGTGSIRTQNWKRRLSDVFTMRRLGGDYVDPHVAEAWERATREIGRSQDWVRSRGREIRGEDPQSGLVETLKGIMRQLSPPVSTATVPVLGRMRARFRGEDEVTSVRALRGVRAEAKAEDPLRVDRLLEPGFLSMLQGVIDDVPHGATPEEAAAMQLLHYHAGGITQAPEAPPPPPPSAPPRGRRLSMRDAIEKSGLAELLRPRLGYDPLARRALDQGPILRAVNQLLQDMPHDPRVREYQRLKGLQQADPLPPPPPDNLLTAEEIEAIEAALVEITAALDRRWDLVSERSADIAAALTGTSGMHVGTSGDTARASSILTLTERSQLELYEAFFTGRWSDADLPPGTPNAKAPVTLENWAELRGHDSGLAVDGVPRVDPNVIRTEILVRMRALEVMGEFSEDLARMGMPTSQADVVPTGVQDRGAFMDDVVQYLRGEMSWSLTRAMDPEGRLVHAPEVGKISPVEEGLTKQFYPKTVKQDAQVHNMEAYTVAQRLLARYGFKRGKGQWERVTLPDGSETIMPTMLREPLEQALEQAADVGKAFDSVAAPRVRSVLPGARRVSTGAERADMDTSVSLGERLRRKAQRLTAEGGPKDVSRDWSVHAAMTVGETIDALLGLFPMVFTKIRQGLTTGVLIPNPAYFTANAVGALLQAYTGRGAKGAAMALGRHPKVTAGVVKRLWGEHTSYPGGGAIVTPDGRIYTADMLADLAKREGLSSSYIQSETAPSLLDDLRDMHRGFYENFVNLPYMAGKWQEFLTNAATGIDNWMRIGTMIDELKLGKSPSEATKIARLVGFDYSKLSPFEKAVARNVIMFYSFMKLNQELFWHTLLRNPYRVLGQLRALKGLTREQLEDDPVLVLPEWYEGRLAAFYEDAEAANAIAQRHVSLARVDGFLYLAPPLPVNDALSLWVNLYDATQSDEKALGESVSRVAPWIQALFVMTMNRDIFYGRDLEAYNDVPPWLVETDRAWTGGALVSGLLRLDPPKPEEDPSRWWTSDSRYVYRITDKTGAKWWWAMKNLGAFAPGFGRSMQTVTSLDRSFDGRGPVEAIVESSRVARNYYSSDEFYEFTGLRADPIAMGEGDTASPRAGLTVGAERLGLFGIRPVPIFTEGEILDRITREKLAEQREALDEIDRRLKR